MMVVSFAKYVVDHMDRYIACCALFRKDGKVQAADASNAASGGLPRRLFLGKREYRPLVGEDTFFFWDELWDSASRIAGFILFVFDIPTLAESRLLRESMNVSMVLEGVARIDLAQCATATWEGVQAFGSEVYQAIDDPRECVVVLQSWSPNASGFELAVCEIHGDHGE